MPAAPMSGMSQRVLASGIEHVWVELYLLQKPCIFRFKSAEANFVRKIEAMRQVRRLPQNKGVRDSFFRKSQYDQEKRGVTYKSFTQDAITLSRSSLI